MNKSCFSEISDEYDEYSEVTQGDLNRAVFRVGLKTVSSHRQRVTILLDTVLVEYFKAKAGETGWQRLYRFGRKSRRSHACACDKTDILMSRKEGTAVCG